MNQSQHFEDVSTLKLPRVIVSPCRYELHLLWFSGMSCRVASDVLCGPGDPLCRPLRCLVSQPASLSIQLPLQSTTDAGLFACLLTSPYVHWSTDLFHSLISTCPHLRRHGGLEEGEYYQNRLCFTVFCTVIYTSSFRHIAAKQLNQNVNVSEITGINNQELKANCSHTTFLS